MRRFIKLPQRREVQIFVLSTFVFSFSFATFQFQFNLLHPIENPIALKKTLNLKPLIIIITDPSNHVICRIRFTETSFSSIFLAFSDRAVLVSIPPILGNPGFYSWFGTKPQTNILSPL